MCMGVSLSLYVFVRACVRVYYTHTYAYTHSHTLTHIYVHIHIFTHVRKHIHTSTNLYTHARAHTRTRAHTHTCAYTRTHAHAFTNTYWVTVHVLPLKYSHINKEHLLTLYGSPLFLLHRQKYINMSRCVVPACTDSI